MISRHRTLADHDEGFTLIELLVVIIIIGILAAIALPVYINQKKKSYEASEKSDLRTVANELESYYAQTPDYTHVSFGSCDGSGAGCAGTSVVGSAVNVGGDIMSISKANTLTLIAAGQFGYCLQATNSNAGGSVNRWYYDSLHGGITKSACTATSSSW